MPSTEENENEIDKIGNDKIEPENSSLEIGTSES